MHGLLSPGESTPKLYLNRLSRRKAHGRDQQTDTTALPREVRGNSPPAVMRASNNSDLN